ncbi:unnamed protein product [Lactuca saligna]|uniref:Exportin-1 C-terminal domain-containing protein n=1 Tax=Lactuca saligna TaxID=75948 RepID=A0AA35ZCG0_LACSI|nr:unnamed protein product [Lactuca saligna]
MNSSTLSSSMSTFNKQLVPRSCSSSATTSFCRAFGNGYNYRSITPGVTRSDSMYSKGGYRSRSPVGFPSVDELIGELINSTPRSGGGTVLKDQDVIRIVLNIRPTNTSAATALEAQFLSQITLIFWDMLTVYKMYSEFISSNIAEGGPFASRTSYVKLLRSLKRETLNLIETFLDKAEDQPQIGNQFVPPMMDPVLGDYARNLPDARESEVLSLFATIINKYKGAMIDDGPCIFEVVFLCTLEGIYVEGIKEEVVLSPGHALSFIAAEHRHVASNNFNVLSSRSHTILTLVFGFRVFGFEVGSGKFWVCPKIY